MESTCSAIITGFYIIFFILFITELTFHDDIHHLDYINVIFILSGCVLDISKHYFINTY